MDGSCGDRLLLEVAEVLISTRDDDDGTGRMRNCFLDVVVVVDENPNTVSNRIILNIINTRRRIVDVRELLRPIAVIIMVVVVVVCQLCVCRRLVAEWLRSGLYSQQAGFEKQMTCVFVF